MTRAALWLQEPLICVMWSAGARAAPADTSATHAYLEAGYRYEHAFVANLSVSTAALEGLANTGVHADGVLVHTALPTPPSELLARTPGDKTIFTEKLGSLAQNGREPAKAKQEDPALTAATQRRPQRLADPNEWFCKLTPTQPVVCR
jgi:hypothetical protein